MVSNPYEKRAPHQSPRKVVYRKVYGKPKGDRWWGAFLLKNLILIIILVIELVIMAVWDKIEVPVSCPYFDRTQSTWADWCTNGQN